MQTNWDCVALSIAAWRNICGPLDTVEERAVPSGLIATINSTFPDTRAARAIGG